MREKNEVNLYLYMLPAKNYENVSDGSPLHSKVRKTSARSVPILKPTKRVKNGTSPIQPFSKVILKIHGNRKIARGKEKSLKYYTGSPPHL